MEGLITSACPLESEAITLLPQAMYSHITMLFPPSQRFGKRPRWLCAKIVCIRVLSMSGCTATRAGSSPLSRAQRLGRSRKLTSSCR